jgi:ADP-ribose pyrophosphatase YjhB (NUDIX family)
MIVVNCFISCGKRLLWVKRGIEPRRGLWAIPGGFLECGEGLVDGAARELREEAGVRVPPDKLHFYMTGTVTFMNQVYMAFRAEVNSDYCVPGIESEACGFFDREECPWDQLGYPEVRASMVQAYDDLDRGEFSIWHSQASRDGYTRWPVVPR